jgi:hypothetical protein
MAKLSAYFQDEQMAHQALDKYHLAFKNIWAIGDHKGKLDLYAKAAHAFDPKTPRADAFNSFKYVYDTIREWMADKRGGTVADANMVFDVFFKDEKRFLSSKELHLANLFYPSPEFEKILTSLPDLAVTKSNDQFPWMAVSKVLHFVNPGLFPIWDWTYIWYKVMYKDPCGKAAAFNAEYTDFCHEHKFTPSENSPQFNLNYTLWAASYIQQSHPDFMAWFMDWMYSNFAQDISKHGLNADLPRYYATAFENVAIGAAYLELGIIDCLEEN